MNYCLLSEPRQVHSFSVHMCLGSILCEQHARKEFSLPRPHPSSLTLEHQGRDEVCFTVVLVVLACSCLTRLSLIHLLGVYAFERSASAEMGM